MTTISWTDETWNPITGCTKVSPGCLNCYAESLTRRFKDRMQPYSDTFAPWTVKAQRESGQPVVTLHPERLDQPLKWKKPRRIFVNSMSDLFHEDVPDEFIDRVFTVMAHRNRHTYQVLTKRPKRMRDYLLQASERVCRRSNWNPNVWVWPLPNVWLGVSVENQRYADERIPLLLETPAAVRFVSCEPLLEAVDLGHATPCGYYCDPWDGGIGGHHDHQFWTPGIKPGLDWVITGCESGRKRRPMELDWARGLRDQCRAAGVPFFLKQMYVDGKRVETPELDGKVWTEYPS